MPAHVWILGLFRSGTTIFWRAWRQDERFLCFDEPFGRLEHLPEDSSKSTHEELIAIFRENPRKFWAQYSPIRALDILQTTLSRAQEAYITQLLARSSQTIVDETRLHFRTQALAQITPRGHLVHLYRRARNFVTSHLRPSYSGDAPFLRRSVRFLRHQYNKQVFWKRRDLPTPYLKETLGKDPDSRFGHLLTDAGYDVERIMSSPTVVRLLAYWHYHFHLLEREGPLHFGPRFLSVRYEDFAMDPASIMRACYDAIGVEAPPGLSFSEVHNPKPAFKPDDLRWSRAAAVAGFSANEIDELL